jgi:hypothetical protein
MSSPQTRRVPRQYARADRQKIRWCDDGSVQPEKFRYNAAIVIACVVAFFGAVPLAASRGYLLPILVIPVLLGIWAWRAGTDATAAGLRVRALFGSRFIPWSDVAALIPSGPREVYAALDGGRRVRLPAVGAADLPRLGKPVTRPDQPTDEPPARSDGPADPPATGTPATETAATDQPAAGTTQTPAERAQ